jgi:hypothetical protein
LEVVFFEVTLVALLLCILRQLRVDADAFTGTAAVRTRDLGGDVVVVKSCIRCKLDEPGA